MPTYVIHPSSVDWFRRTVELVHSTGGTVVLVNTPKLRPREAMFANSTEYGKFEKLAQTFAGWPGVVVLDSEGALASPLDIDGSRRSPDSLGPDQTLLTLDDYSDWDHVSETGSKRLMNWLAAELVDAGLANSDLCESRR
jgi:hypothetical protein